MHRFTQRQRGRSSSQRGDRHALSSITGNQRSHMSDAEQPRRSSAPACPLTISQIAVRAGVSKTTVRKALKKAARLGLLTTEEQGPNLAVRIISREWLEWIAKGRPQAPCVLRLEGPPREKPPG